MRSKRRRLTVVGFVALSVALSACAASIPESGPIIEGPAGGAGADGQVIRVIARPPADGATPVDIVRGFLEANASFQDDYAVARAYLTTSSATTWNPAAQTAVYDGSAAKVAPEGEAKATLTAPFLGVIDSQGSYSVEPSGSVVDKAFETVRENGQWRITAPPAGLLLNRNDVERGYRTYNAYFLDPQFGTVVPDPLTIPSVGSAVATTLVRRLLAGPTEWLAPAVRTAFPQGASLAIDSVPVDGGIAQVSLDASALALDEKTRAALSAQIVWTLRQLPEIAGVRISAGGVPLTVAGQPAVQTVDAWPTFNPDAFAPTAVGYAITDKGVVRLRTDGAEVVSGAAGSGKTGLSSIAIAGDGLTIAAVDAKGEKLVQAPVAEGSAWRTRIEGTGLASIGFDHEGTVWWVDVNGVHAFAQIGPTTIPVTVEGVGRARPVGISVSRDGTRAAVLLRRGPRTEVALMRIERRGDGIRLSGARRVESVIGSAVDVAWASATELAVLGSEGAGPLQVFSIELGPAAIRAIAAPPAATSIAAAPLRDILVGSSSGTIWDYDRLQWRAALVGRSPTYPG